MIDVRGEPEGTLIGVQGIDDDERDVLVANKSLDFVAFWGRIDDHFRPQPNWVGVGHPEASEPPNDVIPSLPRDDIRHPSLACATPEKVPSLGHRYRELRDQRGLADLWIGG